MAEDVRDMQRKLKEMQLRAKMETKMEKKKLRDEKIKMKLHKKQEKVRRKMEKQGRLPPDELKKYDLVAEKKEPVVPSEKIVKAEVVEFKAEEWRRRSVQSIDEVEKKIDRFSGSGVKGLSDRYREKYGEDLKVPELYQIETTLEMESEADRILKEDDIRSMEKEIEASEPEKSKGFNILKREKVAEIEIPKEKPELRFMDLSSAIMFLLRRFGEGSGIIKKFFLVLFDLIILIVLFPITLIRIITTIVYVSKRRKARKLARMSTEGVTVAEA